MNTRLSFIKTPGQSTRWTWFELFEAVCTLSPREDGTRVQRALQQIQGVLHNEPDICIFALVPLPQGAEPAPDPVVVLTRDVLALLCRRLDERLRLPGDADGECHDNDLLHVLHPLRDKLRALKRMEQDYQIRPRYPIGDLSSLPEDETDALFPVTVQLQDEWDARGTRMGEPAHLPKGFSTVMGNLVAKLEVWVSQAMPTEAMPWQAEPTRVVEFEPPAGGFYPPGFLGQLEIEADGMTRLFLWERSIWKEEGRGRDETVQRLTQRCYGAIVREYRTLRSMPHISILWLN